MFKLFNYQNKAIEAIFNHFNSDKEGNPLIVAPTGSGKSVIIADFCKQVIENWDDQKILVLSHDSEILTQDYKAICSQVSDPEVVGLYSSGLKLKQIKQITVAGIQSVFNKKKHFKDFNVIIIDEAHTVSYDKKSRYRIFLKDWKKPVIGFTATPFRLGTGYIHLSEGSLFSEIAYDITIKSLQEAGRLCRIISKQPGVTLNASEVKKQAGDFIIKELSMAFDRESITSEIVSDMVKHKESRKKWLVYAIDIEHCKHICDSLNNAGVKSIALHSKTEGGRKPVLDKFRQGEYQAVVSVAMLTTGVDIPEVDLIALLRPTASPVLHIQIIGRGMRVSPLKENCLVLDYAGNLMRNGPIDSPTILIKGKGNGDPIMKVCERCNEIVPIATRVCKSCGSIFEFKHNLTMDSAEREVLSQTDWYDVDDVRYETYIGSKKIEMLRVIYTCGFKSFQEHVCFDHYGYAKFKAKHWWKRRSKDGSMPVTSKQAWILSYNLSTPEKILVDESGKYDDIKEQLFKQT